MDLPRKQLTRLSKVGENNMNRFHENDIVYVNSAYNVAEKCKIVDYPYSKDNKNIYGVRSLEHGGTFGATPEQVFGTKEEALRTAKAVSCARIMLYKEHLNSIKDLLEFSVDNCLCGEYTDWDALQAFKERAKDITGLTFSWDKED